MHLVATRSYVTYSEPALKDKLENNPYTFLRVINPDWEGEKLHGSEKFEAVRSEFHRFMDEGYFVQDEKPAYYLYEQVVRGRSFMGIIGGAAVDDYAEGMIRKHEDTLSAREAMFKEYLKVTDFNAEPVLLSYPDIPGLDVIVARHRMERPEYEFYTTDGHLHRLWAIDEEEDHHSIEGYFQRIPALYIADGHHRCASSALLSEEICSHSPEARENGIYKVSKNIAEMRTYENGVGETFSCGSAALAVTSLCIKNKFKTISPGGELSFIKKNNANIENQGVAQVVQKWDEC